MHSYGGDAAELAEAAGLRLEPWQIDGLDLMLSLRPGDEHWACFEYAEICARQNGKTAMFQARALVGLLSLGEHLIVWSAHEYKTAMRAFADLRRLIVKLGERVRDNVVAIGDIEIKITNTNGEESFERLDTGAMIKLVARTKGSGRGFSADCLLIDEAFAYTRAQQSALMPTMTARPNPQICYASSPPLDSFSGEPLFALRERALKGDTQGLGYRDWGIGGDLDDLAKMTPDEQAALLDDRHNWAIANPALGLGRVTEESLLRNRVTLSDEDFARECLGVWPLPASEAGGEIPAAAWAAIANPKAEPAGRPTFALDVPDDRTGAAILMAARTADGPVLVEMYDDRRGLDWVIARCVELNTKANPICFALDPTSPAGALTIGLRGAGLKVIEVTGRAYVQACGEFYDAVMEGRLVHRDQPALTRAAEGAQRRDIGDGAWAWARRKSTTDIRAVVAATLAHHSLLEHEATAVEPWADWV